MLKRKAERSENDENENVLKRQYNPCNTVETPAWFSDEYDLSSRTHFAVTEGRIDILDDLIHNEGAEININNQHGMNIFLYNAVFIGNLMMVNYLIQQLNKRNVRIDIFYYTVLAVSSDSFGVAVFFIDELLRQGININHVRDEQGNTLLHIALSQKNFNLADYLIEKRLDVDSVDSFNRTALHWAAEKQQANVIHYLVKRGARDNIFDIDGKTPLELSKEKGVRPL